MTHTARAARIGVVLMVDDDPANRDWACRMRGADYLVQSAADCLRQTVATVLAKR